MKVTKRTTVEITDLPGGWALSLDESGAVRFAGAATMTAEEAKEVHEALGILLETAGQGEDVARAVAEPAPIETAAASLIFDFGDQIPDRISLVHDKDGDLWARVDQSQQWLPTFVRGRFQAALEPCRETFMLSNFGPVTGVDR